MAGARRDIAVAKQRALVDLRIELGLHLHVAEVARPAHEMRHRPLRPVAVEHLDGQPARLEIGHHLRQRRGGLPGQIADRLVVAVDRLADEIVRGGVARLDQQARRDGGRIDEGVGALGLWLREGRARVERQHDGAMIAARIMILCSEIVAAAQPSSHATARIGAPVPPLILIGKPMNRKRPLPTSLSRLTSPSMCVKPMSRQT